MRKTTPSICSHPACNARPVHTDGSNSEVELADADFRFTPKNGLKSDIAPCPKSADFVAKVGYGGWMPVSHSTIDDRP
jgi:hypothetical protein